ncbi:MAG: AAA family ATPase, partial [Spirochaetota bacterium]
KLLKKLTFWAKKKNRKPLILRGARQTGKTTVIALFAKEFDNYIYLNLELTEDKEVFSKPLAVHDCVQLILLSKNITLKPGRTLIFIDEIQNSPIAVGLMRYFYESLPEYHVIAAGSLLEILMEKENISFPVGRVEFEFLYPMSFEEFLLASGNDTAIGYYNTVPCPDFAIPSLLKLFHNYTMLGGMPEILSRYFAGESISQLQSVYQSLMYSYSDDISKYASSRSQEQILRFAIEVLSFEAGKRIKFQGFGNSNYRSREIGEALRILQRAMLIRLVYPTTNFILPSMANYKKAPKLQFLDTGLLNYKVGLQAEFIKYDSLHAFYRGLIAEHVVGQELQTNLQQDLLFWTREEKHSNAELDFVMNIEGNLLPIEVKSGKVGRLRSLHQFMDHSTIAQAIRLYDGNLEIQNTSTITGNNFQLLNLPYCFAGKIAEYYQWMNGI